MDFQPKYNAATTTSTNMNYNNQTQATFSNSFGNGLPNNGITNLQNNMPNDPTMYNNSSNNIYGTNTHSTPINNSVTTTSYEPAPLIPSNPADIVQIPLRISSARKKCNVAKFHTPHNQPMEFAKMAQPVKMYRAPEVSEQEPAPPPKENPFFKKKHTYERKVVPKDAKAVPWHVEDADANHSYDGTLEGGQTSNYALLVFENGVFNVIPAGDWYNFKPKRSYQTFSTEEAENMMNKRHELAKRLAEKLLQNQPVKAEDGGGGGSGGGGGASSSGAGERDKEDAEFTTTTEDDDPDRFAAFGRADSDEEKKKKQTKQKKVKKGNDEEEENGEEPDWEGVFDDDEPVGMEEEDPVPGRAEESEGEGEGESEDKNLTEAGKELRNILKKQKEDDISDAELGSESDPDDEEDDDDFNLEEKLPFISPLLKLNNSNNNGNNNTTYSTDTKMEDSKDQDDSRPSPQQTDPSGEKEKKKSPPTGAKKKARSKDKEKDKETKDETPKGEKAKKSRSKKAGATPSAKRGASEGGAAELKSPTIKKPRLETPRPEPSPPLKPAAAPAKPAAAGPAVTEEEVKRVLQGKRLRTLDLINYFKAALTDKVQKAKFTDITRRLCTINDENGVKYLLLKQ